MMGLPNCRDVTRQLSADYDAARVIGRAGLRLRLHLMMCRACRRYQRYLIWLRLNVAWALALSTTMRLTESQRAHIRRGLQRSGE